MLKMQLSSKYSESVFRKTDFDVCFMDSKAHGKIKKVQD